MNKEGQLIEKGRELMRKLNVRCKDDIPRIVESLKQQLQAKSQRLQRFHQSKTYEQNAEKFYRALGKKNIIIHQAPEKEFVENCWSSIWEEEKRHNVNA